MLGPLLGTFSLLYAYLYNLKSLAARLLLGRGINQGGQTQKFEKAKLAQKHAKYDQKRPKFEKLYKQHKAKNYCKVYTHKAKFL